MYSVLRPCAVAPSSLCSKPADTSAPSRPRTSSLLSPKLDHSKLERISIRRHQPLHALRTSRPPRARTCALLNPSAELDAVSPVILTAIAGAVGQSTWRLLSCKSEQQDAPMLTNREQEDEASLFEINDSLLWGLWSIISCIPYFNFLAFVGIRAMDPYRTTPEQLLVYSAVYAVPFLHCGLHPDLLALASVAACAAHVQLERATWTRTSGSAEALPPPPAGFPRAGSDAKVPSALADVSRAVTDLLQREEAPAAAEAREADVAAGSDTPAKSIPDGVERILDTVVEVVDAGRKMPTRLQEKLDEKKLEAELVETQRSLEAQVAATEAELDAWDQQYDLRTSTRSQLLDIARQRKLRGYSKLRKGELLELIEGSAEMDDEDET